MQVFRSIIELSPRAEGVGVVSQDRVESWSPSCVILNGESNWGERVLSDRAGNRECGILLGINVGGYSKCAVMLNRYTKPRLDLPDGRFWH
jgi:hypothetical protein